MSTDGTEESVALGGVAGELQRIGDLAQGVGRSLRDAFRGAILDGKSLNGVLAEIGKAMAEIALKAALQPVSGMVSGLVESLFKATDPALTGVKAFAKGGVIAAPTYFGAGGGIGLAGEAGPEAILPLTRGADGRLGVAGGGAVSVHVAITTPDARSFLGAEAEIGAMLVRAVKRGTRAS